MTYIVLNIKNNCINILSKILDILNKKETINELTLDNVAKISGFLCYLNSTNKINLIYSCLDQVRPIYFDKNNKTIIGCITMKFIKNNNINGGKYNNYIKKIDYYYNKKNNYKLNKYLYKIIFII